MSDNEQPAFGYDAHDRPLWSVRDRDARRSGRCCAGPGHRELSERRGGFVVEAADASQDGAEPFSMTCTDEKLLAAGSWTATR
jgi:hypothetical protein